ncbi:MAG: choice-of-anchor D domain-containing protein, partial [Candidatus Kapabacteria bacterium]|nr:choice-of-anchor D domain-containing protein [Candidatus Kapabacteria bacterium]
GSTGNWVGGASITQQTSTYTPAPEINIQGNANTIVDGTTTVSTTTATDFGITLPSTNVTKTYTIQNTGNATLNVNSISMSGTNPSAFTVGGITTPTTVAAGSSTTFTVTFNATNVQIYNAVVNVMNDDCDEATYNYAVKCEIQCTNPTISNPGNQSVNAPTGSCSATVTYTTTVTGVPTPSLTYTFTGATTGTGSGNGSGSTFNKGVTNVVVSATNACSTATASFTITVNDVEPPSVTCASNVVVNNTAGTCGMAVTLTPPTVTDNCPATFGNALDFDGSAPEYASLPSGVYFNGSFTIEAWVYPKQMSNWSRIIDFGNGAGSNNVLLGYTYGTTGQPGLYIEGTQIAAGQTLPLNQWSHVAATFTSSGSTGTGTIYINGVPTASSTFPTPVNVVRNNNYIGRSNWGLGDPDANAIFDEIRIWNVAKTQAQIQAQMNTELTGNESGLQIYFNMNQGTAGGNNTAITQLIDVAPAGGTTNATINGIALSGATSNFVAGKTGFSLTNNAPATFPRGTTSVLWTATDASGNSSTCTQTVTVNEPEINVKGTDGSNIASGTTATGTANGTDFGTFTTAAVTKTFTIENIGTTALSLTGASPVTVSGAAASDYTITTQPSSSVAVNGSTTFTVSFTPSALGARNATISIANNDCDENPYTFNVTGQGQPAAGLAFDGVDDYAEAVVSTLPQGNANRTIEAWYKGTDIDGVIANWGQIANNQRFGLIIHNDELYVVGEFNDFAIPRTTFIVNDGNWHHLATTFDGTTLRVYGDGNLLGQSTKSFTTTGTTLRIGRRAVPQDGEYVQGTIDEVRVWNTARSCEEIRQFRNCELAGTETGLLVYYKFNQGVANGNNASISTITNAVSGGASATLINMSKTGVTSNFTTPGGVSTGNSCPTSIVFPEINVQGGSPLTNIVSGQTQASVANGTDFGGIATASVTRNFTIQNTGTSVLNISSITSSNPGEYAISGVPATVGAGSSATFTVTFTPAGNGDRVATVTVTNNDCDESVYTFNLIGGKQASALAFDGGNDYVNIGTPLTTNNGSYTKEAWIYVTSSGSNKNIISSLSNPFWVNNGTLLAGNNGNYFVVQDPTPLTLNSWIHVAVTYDAATSTMRLYRDGVLVNQNSSAPVFVPEASNIGAHYGTGVSVFQGMIDEARIWNTVRSCEEIRQNRNGELTGSEPGLVAYYKFNQGVINGTNTNITTLTNSVSGGTNGTLNNFALANTNSTSNWTAPGGVVTGTPAPASITYPEINLQGGSPLANIVDTPPGLSAATPSTTNGTDFGNITICSGSVSKTYTIQNTGTSNLVLTGTAPNYVTITGTNASLFTVTSQPGLVTLAPNQSTTFTVQFASTTTGVKNATVNIANNDCDEPLYDFAIRGTAIDTYTFTGTGTWDDVSKWSPSYPGTTLPQQCSVVVAGNATIPTQMEVTTGGVF